MMAFMGSDAWTPFREMRRLSRALDGMMARGPWVLPSWLMVEEFPPINIYTTDEDVFASFELPGVKPEDVELTVTADTLTLSGQRAPGVAAESVNYYRRERRTGGFARSINLPERVKTDKVEAKYNEGILTVRMPKSEEARARRIQVSGTEAR